jgi:hypothetical protein
LGWSIVALGAAARIRLYAANRSLWTDEAMLAGNLLSRSFSGLCRPLDHNQGAPLLFLWAERLAVVTLGGGEERIRLIPLLAGIATLVLFLQFARRHLTVAAGLIALAALAFAKDLLRYSAEDKQYSTDATVALVLLWLAVRALSASDLDCDGQERGGRSRRGRALIVFACGSALGAWLSHPAVFIVAGCGAALFLAELFHRDPRAIAAAPSTKVLRLGQVSLATSVGLASGLAQYLLLSRSLVANAYLLKFWDDGMMPLPPSLRTLRWVASTLPEAASNPFGVTGAWPGAALIALGIVIVAARPARRPWCYLLALPICLALCASAVHKYPFRHRLIVFLTPSLAILTGLAIPAIVAIIAQRRRWIPVAWGIGALSLAAVLGEPLANCVSALRSPPMREEIKPVLAAVARARQGEDLVCVPSATEPAFAYYAARYDMNDARTFYLGGPPSSTSTWLYRQRLAALSGRRAWLILSHYTDGEEAALLAAAEELGARKLQRVAGHGSEAYLLQFAPDSRASGRLGF